MHNVALRRLLVQQRMEDLEREAMRLKVGRPSMRLSAPARVAHALRVGAAVYRSPETEPDPEGAVCVVGDSEGVLVWTSTAKGTRALTCQPRP